MPALYLVNSAHSLIGCCTAFTYYDNDGTLTHELSVLIAPEYRRHGLGRMLVMQMLSVIEAVYTKTEPTMPQPAVLLQSQTALT